MAKHAIFTALIAILLAQSCHADLTTSHGRRLRLEAREVCRTVAALQLVVTEGSCEGTATATCQVVLDTLGKVVEAYKTWWKDNGLCDQDKMSAAISAISDIMGTLWLETAAKITCTGVGYGCGWSAASSPSWIEGVGDALRATAKDAGSKDRGFCIKDIDDLVPRSGVDIEESRKEVCTNGGTAEELGKVVKSLFTKALTTSFKKATSSACNGNEVTSCKGLMPKGKDGKPKKEKGKKDEEGKDKKKEGDDEKDGSEEGASEEVDSSDEVKSVDVIDIIGDPSLEDIIIVAPEEKAPESAAAAASDSGSISSNEDSTESQEADEPPKESCSCAEDMCGDARCRAHKFANCRTVPDDGKDCSKCSPKFYIEEEEVSCDIGKCKPEGKFCTNKSLAKCCGVCCRCESYVKKFKDLGDLEIGFCQDGPICDCLSNPRRGFVG